MPRSKRAIGSVRGGVRVPGIYAALLERERELFAGRQTVFYVDPNDPSAGHFRRSTHLLDALEAGEPAAVAAWELSSLRVHVPESLRPGNCRAGAWWRVTPDDVVERGGSPVVDRPVPVLTVAQDE
jgi:hypothetical protein